MTLTFLLLLGLAPAAEAAVSPPRSPEPRMPGLVRVSLGHHSRIGISGHDLKLNGVTLYGGESAFSVRCGFDAEGNPQVVYGTGINSRDKLEISAPSGFFRMNGKLYREALTIHARGSSCLAVNTVSLDSYLAGLINKEMSPSWPLEALKAQAVASRSYAIFKISQNQSREFDLESTVQDQVYDGAASETSKSSLAVSATRGLVLASSGKPLKAYFHANCGGKTESPDSVWGGSAAAFRPVVCPYHHRKRDRENWQVRLTKPQIEGALRKVAGLLPRGFRGLASLEAGAPNGNQRLSDVFLSDGGGNNLLVPAQDFRNALGNTRIKSTSFRIAADRDGYRIEGEGFGHGVGMCQVGARAMAEQGKTFRQILTHYYPLAKIRGL